MTAWEKTEAASEGMEMFEQAAEQGHVYAMCRLGSIHNERKEHERASEWFTKGADAGLPQAMYGLAYMLDTGEGAGAPDYPAAVGWYMRAADAGSGDAASNLSNMCALGRGMASHKMPDTSSPQLDPRMLSLIASYDVSSMVCQAL